MDLVKPSETGESTSLTKTAAVSAFVKLSQSQGARSTTYDIPEPTGKIKITGWRRTRTHAKASGFVPTKPTREGIAEREHIARQLRQCSRLGEELLQTTDPVDSALVGAKLVSAIKELWEHRSSREDDWGEILNILQICIAGQEFESFSKEKRLALVSIFADCLVSRTVGRLETERALEILSNANFNVWRGLREGELDQQEK